jgi:hypothetical protein
MTISAKGRRRIEVDGQSFLWWVAECVDDDFAGASALTIASTDKKLLVRYGLCQPDASRYIVVLGSVFRGMPNLGGRWRRFRCPQFGTFESVTPRDVADLIRWCCARGEPATEVDYRGIPFA